MHRVFALLLSVFVVSCSAGKESGSTAMGGIAPVFSARGLGGDTVSLAALRGKVVVLNEWATWCEPCRDELPQLQALHLQYASKGLVMIGVSVDAAGSGADVRDFAREHGMTYPIWLDPDKEFALKFLTMGVPVTFLVDRTGTIRFRKIGALAIGDTTLASAIRAALGS
ncbi:MAG: TlpA disulfide reductase family protein [bacterium]